MRDGVPPQGLISVLVVDDHPVLRWGLTAVLEESGVARVVGEAADGRAAVTACMTLRPDVVVMDLGMPDVDGVEATVKIRQACPRSVVVVLTAERRRVRAQDALAAGAFAVVSKGSQASTLLRAVQAAAAHGASLAEARAASS